MPALDKLPPLNSIDLPSERESARVRKPIKVKGMTIDNDLLLDVPLSRRAGTTLDNYPATTVA